MPPAYVKPYVKRQKNDRTDSEAVLVGTNRMLALPTASHIDQKSKAVWCSIAFGICLSENRHR
jgi:hypothetical protein